MRVRRVGHGGVENMEVDGLEETHIQQEEVVRSCPPSKLEPGEIAAHIASRRARSWPTWSTVCPEAPMDFCQGLLASIDPDLEAELSANVTPVRVDSGVTSRHGRGWFPLQLGKRKGWAALKRGGCNGAEQLLLASLSKHRFESPHDVQHPSHSSAGHVSASWTRTLAEYMAARRSNRRIMGRAVRSGIMFQLTRAIAHANGMGVSHLDVRGENVVCVLDERLFSVRLTGWDSAWMTAEGFRDIGASVSARPELPACSMPCRAPELLLDQDDAVLLFAKCDVWSLGCVVVEMLSAKPFFRPEPTEMRMFARLMRTLGTPSIDALMAISSPLPGEGQSRLGVAEDAHFMSFGRELLLRHKPARVWSSTFKNVGITRDECRVIEAMLVWDPTKRLSAASLLTCAYFDAVRIPSTGIARECSARAAVQFDCHAPFTDGELKGLASCEKSALRRQARVPTLSTRPLSGSHLGSSTLATIEDDDDDDDDGE